MNETLLEILCDKYKNLDIDILFDIYDEIHSYYGLLTIQDSKNYNSEKLKSLINASRPLIKYLNDNHTPHTSAVVTTTGVEILSGIQNYNTEDFIKD